MGLSQVGENRQGKAEAAFPLLGVSHKREFRLSQPFMAFHKNLLALLQEKGCQEAIERLTPELVQYLFHLHERSGVAPDMDEALKHQFERFLQAIGHKLRSLLQEFDKARSSGKKFIGLMEILALIADHQVAIAKEEDKGYDEFEFLTSSMADREPPIGLLVALPNRHSHLWRVDFSEERKGAFVYILRPHDQPHGLALVVCRGTAGRLTAAGGAMTFYNDLTEQLGMPGIQGIWFPLRSYFQSNRALQTEVLGKSLGGGIAQGLGVLIQGTRLAAVQKLVTTCSTGVCDQVHDAYNSLPATLRFPIRRFRLARMDKLPNDLVPKTGGDHLGTGRSAGADFEDYNVGVTSTPDQVIEPASTHKRGFLSLVTLFRAIGKTHTRQMRWVEGKRVVLRPAKKIRGSRMDHHGSDRLLERLRLKLATPLVNILRKIKPSTFDYEPFSEFYAKAIVSMPLTPAAAHDPSIFV